MKISIAMATYNGAQYLKAQLQSFVAQTLQPDELIITDDCSTDETEIIVQQFAETAPFKVEFHRNEQNLGYCGNFNAALMKTTGDLVYLSDQDDVWFPEKINHIAEAAKRNPKALVLMNDAALTDVELNEVGLTKMGQIQSAGFSLDRFVMGCCCAVRRELLDFCMPIPSGFTSHDKWLVWFADGLNAKVVVPKVLQYYRRHESNTSQFIVNRTTRVTRFRALAHSIENVFRKDLSDQARSQLEQLNIFVEVVHDIQSKAPDDYRDLLNKLENRFRQYIKTTESRIVVLEKRLIPRMVAVSRLYIRGGYSTTGGLKTVLRDIIG